MLCVGALVSPGGGVVLLYWREFLIIPADGHGLRDSEASKNCRPRASRASRSRTAGGCGRPISESAHRIKFKLFGFGRSSTGLTRQKLGGAQFDSSTQARYGAPVTRGNSTRHMSIENMELWFRTAIVQLPLLFSRRMYYVLHRSHRYSSSLDLG